MELAIKRKLYICIINLCLVWTRVKLAWDKLAVYFRIYGQVKKCDGYNNSSTGGLKQILPVIHFQIYMIYGTKQLGEQSSLAWTFFFFFQDPHLFSPNY